MRIASLNVNGIRNTLRIQSIKHYIEKFHIHILFLQETHVDNLKLGREIEDELGGKVYWSFTQPDQRGVGIFISNRLDINIAKFHHDIEGRLIYVDIDTNIDLRLINIYAPSHDKKGRKQFFRDLIHVVNTSRTIILGGDFNCVENINLDKIGGNPTTGTEGIKELNDIKMATSLTDIFRHYNPDKIATTWKSKEIATRLDRFYIQKAKLYRTKNFQQELTYSDHELIYFDLHLPENNTNSGKGYWKLPNHLIQDNNFGFQICYDMTNFLSENNNRNIIEWWDDFKDNIKTVATKWCKNKRKAEDIEYTQLCSEYRQYELEKNFEEMNRIKLILNYYSVIKASNIY